MFNKKIKSTILLSAGLLISLFFSGARFVQANCCFSDQIMLSNRCVFTTGNDCSNLEPAGAYQLLPDEECYKKTACCEALGGSCENSCPILTTQAPFNTTCDDGKICCVASNPGIPPERDYCCVRHYNDPGRWGPGNCYTPSNAQNACLSGDTAINKKCSELQECRGEPRETGEERCRANNGVCATSSICPSGHIDLGFDCHQGSRCCRNPFSYANACGPDKNNPCRNPATLVRNSLFCQTSNDRERCNWQCTIGGAVIRCSSNQAISNYQSGQNNNGLQNNGSNGGQTTQTTNQANDCGEEGLKGVDFLLFHGPLVPCGINKECAGGGSGGNEEVRSINKVCTLCHFIILIKNIFDLILSLLIVVSLLMLTIAGVLYIVSGGARLTGLAKEIIQKTIFGFSLFLLSWLVVYTILNFLSVNKDMIGKGGDDGWFQFSCDTESSFNISQGGGVGVGNRGGGTDVGNRGGGTDVGNRGGGAGTGETGGRKAERRAQKSPRSYDPGIQAQEADASPALREFMDCMDWYLSPEANHISSISDSAGIDRCAFNYSKPPCAHKRNSCHYGGTNCRGQSYAVDYGREDLVDEISAAARACGAWVNPELNHVHVSIGSRYNCGCH